MHPEDSLDRFFRPDPWYIIHPMADVPEEGLPETHQDLGKNLFTSWKFLTECGMRIIAPKLEVS